MCVKWICAKCPKWLEYGWKMLINTVGTFVHRTFSNCIQTRGRDTVSITVERSSNILQNISSNQRDNIISEYDKNNLEIKHKNPTKPILRYIKVYIMNVQFRNCHDKKNLWEAHKIRESNVTAFSSMAILRVKGQSLIQYNQGFQSCSPRHDRNRAEAAERFLWM